MIELLVIFILLLSLVLGFSGLVRISKIKNSNIDYVKNETSTRSNLDDYNFRIAC